MTAFRFAFRDYLKALTIKDTKPSICWDGSKYIVNWYFSTRQCEKLGWEVLHG